MFPTKRPTKSIAQKLNALDKRIAEAYAEGYVADADMLLDERFELQTRERELLERRYG